MSGFFPTSQGPRQQQRTPLSDHSSHINSSDFASNRGAKKMGSATRVRRNTKTSIPPPRDGPRFSSSINTKPVSTNIMHTDNGSTQRVKNSSVRDEVNKYVSPAAFDPFDTKSINSSSIVDGESVASSAKNDFSNQQGLNKALEEMKENRVNSQQKRLKLHQERQFRDKSIHNYDQQDSVDTERISNSESITLSMDEYERLKSTAEKRDEIGRIVQERLSFAADKNLQNASSIDGEMKEQYEKEISRLRKELDEIKFFNDLDESFDAEGNKLNRSTAASIFHDARDVKIKLEKALQSTKDLEMENTYLRQKNQILLKEKQSLSANVELFQTTNLSSDKKTQLTFHLQSQVISLKSCLEEETLRREKAETSVEEIKYNYDNQINKLASENSAKIKGLEDLLAKKEKDWEEKLSEEKAKTDTIIEELKETICSKDDELEELNQNLTNGLALVKELEEELTPLQEKIDSQIEIIERSKIQIKNHKNTIDELHKKLNDNIVKSEEEMEVVIQSHKEKIQAMDNEVRDMKEKYESSSAEVANQTEEVKLLNEQIISIKREANEKMELLIQSCDEEVKERETEILLFKEDLERESTGLIDESEKKITDLKSKHHEELKNTRAKYESRLTEQIALEKISQKELKETLTELDVSKKKVSELELMNSNSRKEFEDDMKILEEEYAKELDQKDNLLDQQFLQIRKLENKINLMNQSHKVSIEEVTELESKHQQAIKMKDQQAANQRRKWSNSDQKLRQQLKEHQETQIETKKQIETLDKKCKDIRKELYETKLIADKNAREKSKVEEEVVALRTNLDMLNLSAKSDQEALQRKIRQLELKLKSANSRTNRNRLSDKNLSISLQGKDNNLDYIKSNTSTMNTSTDSQHSANTSPQKDMNCSMSVGTKSTSSCTTASVDEKILIQKKESTPQPSPNRIRARKKLEEAALKRYMSHRQKRNQHML